MASGLWTWMKTYGPPIIAWTALILLPGSLFSIVIPELRCTSLVSVYLAAMTVLIISIFLQITYMDPGIHPKAPKYHLADDTTPPDKEVEINGVIVYIKWCSTCNFYRPPRASHCRACDTCVELNNCVGRRNYRFFFFLICLISLYMAVTFLLLLYAVRDQDAELSDKALITSIVILVFIGLAFLPVFGLAVFHVYLVSKATTTYEMIKKKFKGDKNPYSLGCWRNLMGTFFGPLWPSVTENYQGDVRSSNKITEKQMKEENHNDEKEEGEVRRRRLAETRGK